jgi:hypothetical protein
LLILSPTIWITNCLSILGGSPNFSHPPHGGKSGMPSARIFFLIAISLAVAAVADQLVNHNPSQKVVELARVGTTAKTNGILPSPMAESRTWGALEIPSPKQVAPAGLGATAVLFFIGKEMRHRRQIRRKIRRIRGY